jgi:hypothetical protein
VLKTLGMAPGNGFSSRPGIRCRALNEAAAGRIYARPLPFLCHSAAVDVSESHSVQEPIGAKSDRATSEVPESMVARSGAEPQAPASSGL